MSGRYFAETEELQPREENNNNKKETGKFHE